jgi:hypothetical protein
MQEQEKVNQVILEKMQIISVQLVKLNAREKDSENSNITSTFVDRGKLPSKL